MSDVYYKLYLDREQRVTVICLQDFDEPDYNSMKFFRGKDGTPKVFDTEEEAVLYLNEHFLPDSIDPEYLSPNNLEFMKP
jgi:hypothetical protein